MASILNNNQAFGLSIGLTAERCMYVELCVNRLLQEAVTAIDKRKAKSAYIYKRIDEEFPSDATERGYAHFLLGWYSAMKNIENINKKTAALGKRFIS